MSADDRTPHPGPIPHMNTPNPHRHRTSLFIRPVFWLAFAVISLGVTNNLKV